MEKKVVYLISPIMSSGDYEENVDAARKAALALWRAGYAVHCPALNTYGMAGKLPEEVFVSGELAIARKCDLYALAGRWGESENCMKEIREMLGRGKKEVADVPLKDLPVTKSNTSLF